MPFGGSNAPATFQRLMENCLGDLNLRWCVVYLDDIIVYGKSPEEILERLGAVFEKLRKAGLKLKPSKCEFFKEQIQFLGHIVSKEGISTCPEKVHAVQEWPIPKTINDLRSFLGFVGYYRKFIKGFSQIAKPLNSLLEGYVNNKRAKKVQTIPWQLEQQEAFNALQQACMSAPILGYPNPEKPFILHTDASLDGLGAVLYQNATTYDEDEEFEIVLPLVRELEGEDHLDLDDGTAQPVKDSDPSILIPRQPQVKFQDQPQVIEDSTLSYSGDSGTGVSSEKECASSASSGVSYNDSTKLSGSGLTCEDPTKPETSLDSSSLYSSVFEEQSSTSRHSAEADTSLEASKSSGPTTVLPQTEEHAAKKASASSEEDDSQDSEPVQAIQPRRSLRSTKGAPPTRFGYAISHKLVCPYFQFMKNGKIQLSSKL